MTRRPEPPFERQPLCLGDLTLDPMDGTLVRGEERDTLKQKSLQVLLCLLRRAPEVVSRDELLQEIWQDVVVTEAVLTTCVWELRAKLGDKHEKPRYIQTVRGRGYRYIGPAPAGRAPEVASTAQLPAHSYAPPWPTGLLVAFVASLLLLSADDRRGAGAASSLDRERARVAYMRGRSLMQTEGRTTETLRWFQRAAELDPDYVPGLVSMLEAAAAQRHRTPDTLERVRRAADRVVDLAPHWDQSRLARVWIEAAETGDLDTAEVQHREIVHLSPHSLRAQARLAWILAAQGRTDEGRELARRALDHRTHDQRGVSMALVALYVNRDFDGVIRRVDESDWWSRAERVPSMRIISGLARVAVGDLAGASEDVDRVLELGVGSKRRGDLGYILASVGRRQEAEAMLQEARAASHRDHYAIAQIYLALGDRDAALEQLSVGLEGDIRYRLRLLADPALDPLRNDVRYPRLASITAPVGSAPAGG